MTTISDYLFQNSSGTIKPRTPVWVKLTNTLNNSLSYISTSATDANGLYTINNVLPGTYIVAAGITNTGPWINTGDNNYLVGGASYIFNVVDYGAKLDGVTDDRGALEACLAAAVASITVTRGALVEIPAGTLYLNSTVSSPPVSPAGGFYNNTIGVALPVNLANNLRIHGAGRASTVIKLSNNARNVFWINKVADYDIFKNVTIEDLSVDNNNTIGRCHVLLGNIPSSITPQRRLNYEQIFIRRIDIINVPVDATQATTAKTGLLLLGTHAAALEATQTHSTDITVEDFRMYGGDGAVGITSWGAGSLVGGTNHYYNHIFVRHWLHDNTAAGVPAATIAQTSVYICGSGFGDYFEITDGESINIGDDAIEVGAMQIGLIDGVRMIDPFLVGILFRHSHAIQDLNRQRIAIRNCNVQIVNGSAVTGFIGRPVNWIGDNSLTFGEFNFYSFMWSSINMFYSKQQQADIAFLLSAPVAKIVFDNLKIELSNYGVDSGAGTVNGSLFRLSALSGVVVVRDVHIIASVTASAGAAMTYQFYAMLHEGEANRMLVDGYTVDLTGSSWTNSTGGGCRMYGVAHVDGLNIRGKLTHFEPLAPVSVSGVGTRPFSMASGANILAYEVSDSDLSAISGANEDIETTAAGTNAAKLLVRNVIGKGSVLLGPHGRRATATSYTALPYDNLIAVTSTSAPRTITLTAANAIPVGQTLTVVDESNAAGTNNITITRAGADTFTDGSTSKVINTNGGTLKVYSNGSNWVVS